VSPGSPVTAREALERSRVDVIAMISDGIPPRAYVPGVPGLLPAGKRIHIAAEKKTGKSLSIAVVTAAQIVAAGGTVVVLDRENGSDEYARRLQDVLDARGADDAFRERVREHLRYHAWPTLSLDWSEDYPEAFVSADVAIFDSSRSHLTPLGLKEDLSDDFAAFTTALIDPLMRAGVTTVILDNAGHLEKDRPRGSSSKGDLCDIAFTMRTLSPFTSTLAGRLELRCTDSRIGEVSGTWHLELGDGHYGTWQKIGVRPPEARDELREAVIEVLVAAAAPRGIDKIGKAIRTRPGNTLRFAAQDLRAGLAAWAADPASGVLRDPAGKGFVAHVGPPRHGPQVRVPATRLDTASTDTAESSAPTDDLPMSDSLDTARPGAHVAESHPLRGDTADTQAADDGYNGWTNAELQALVDTERDLNAEAETGR
jgi:AAA domain